MKFLILLAVVAAAMAQGMSPPMGRPGKSPKDRPFVEDPATYMRPLPKGIPDYCFEPNLGNEPLDWPPPPKENDHFHHYGPPHFHDWHRNSFWGCFCPKDFGPAIQGFMECGMHAVEQWYPFCHDHINATFMDLTADGPLTAIQTMGAEALAEIDAFLSQPEFQKFAFMKESDEVQAIHLGMDLLTEVIGNEAAKNESMYKLKMIMEPIKWMCYGAFAHNQVQNSECSYDQADSYTPTLPPWLQGMMEHEEMEDLEECEEEAWDMGFEGSFDFSFDPFYYYDGSDSFGFYKRDESSGDDEDCDSEDHPAKEAKEAKEQKRDSMDDEDDEDCDGPSGERPYPRPHRPPHTTQAP